MTALLLVVAANTAFAVLLGGVATLADWLGRPAVAHGLWLLALLKLVAPPLHSVRVPLAEPLAPVAHTLDPPAPPRVWTRAAPSEPVAVFKGWAVVGTVWAGGSGLCLLVGGRRVRRLIRLLSMAPRADQALEREVGDVAAQIGLRRMPVIHVVAGRISPMVVWLGRTVLVLPDAFLALPEARRRALVGHELAHLRRRDHLVRWVEAAITCVLWWNPAVWWIRRGMHEAEEQCSDAWVVRASPSSREPLASGLLDAATRFDLRGAPLTVGLGRVRQLRRRITSILATTAQPDLSTPGRIAALATCLALSMAPGVGCQPEAPRSLFPEPFPGAIQAAVDGWRLSGKGRYRYEVQSDPAAADALTFVPTEDPGGSYVTWMRSIDATPYVGQRVRVAARTRTERAAVRVELWARVQHINSPGDGPGIGGGVVPLPATSDWRREEIVFDVPEEGVWLQYGVGIAGPGSLWFEQPTLEVVAP